MKDEPKHEPVSHFAIIAKFVRVVKLWRQLESLPRRFGIDEDLYSSEIHLIEAIGNKGKQGVTDLSRVLGVTKGAVSQTLKKLENKNLVAKYADPENSSRVLVGLTAKGKAAYYAHEYWHEKMDGGFREYFMRLPEEKIRFLDEFLSTLEIFLGKHL